MKPLLHQMAVFACVAALAAWGGAGVRARPGPPAADAGDRINLGAAACDLGDGLAVRGRFTDAAASSPRDPRSESERLLDNLQRVPERFERTAYNEPGDATRSSPTAPSVQVEDRALRFGAPTERDALRLSGGSRWGWLTDEVAAARRAGGRDDGSALQGWIRPRWGGMSRWESAERDWAYPAPSDDRPLRASGLGTGETRPWQRGDGAWAPRPADGAGETSPWGGPGVGSGPR